MEKILVITALLIGCIKEDISPIETIDNIVQIELSNDINLLTSRISLVILMNSNINKEPFSDLHLKPFTDFLISNKTRPNGISAEKVATHILKKVEEGIPHNKIAQTVIFHFRKGDFEAPSKKADFQ